MLRIGIVTGEPSGDNLGADLIASIKNIYPDVVVEGIGGPKLIASGCHSFYDMERLSVMGLFEILGRYFELLKMQRYIKRYFSEQKPDVFIGIDSPDFTLSIEKTLRSVGVKTVHYVSPSVWAWRENRLNYIRQSTDLMLTLFPFEAQYYEQNAIPVKFVGHPLANEIPMLSDKKLARQQLGIKSDCPVLAILPGSRAGEVNRLTKPFLAAANICQQNLSGLQLIAGLYNERTADLFATKLASSPDINVKSYINQTRKVLAAADVVLLASGTATLETMLVKRPMVVAYKANWLTYSIIKPMIKVPYVSLPNLITGEELVPEFLQNQCQPENLAQACMNYFNNPTVVNSLEDTFNKLHQQLQATNQTAAGDAILSIMDLSNNE